MQQFIKEYSKNNKSHIDTYCTASKRTPIAPHFLKMAIGNIDKCIDKKKMRF